MVLDVMTYSIMAVAATLAFVTVLLASHPLGVKQKVRK
jgi:hypothetical protein